MDVGYAKLLCYRVCQQPVAGILIMGAGKVMGMGSLVVKHGSLQKGGRPAMRCSHLIESMACMHMESRISNNLAI